MMASRIFLEALDRYGETMNLDMTEHEVLTIIDILWVRRRNKMLGARWIDFFRDLGSEQEEILVEEKKVNLKEVEKKVEDYKRMKGL